VINKIQKLEGEKSAKQKEIDEGNEILIKYVDIINSSNTTSSKLNNAISDEDEYQKMIETRMVLMQKICNTITNRDILDKVTYVINHYYYECMVQEYNKFSIDVLKNITNNRKLKELVDPLVDIIKLKNKKYQLSVESSEDEMLENKFGFSNIPIFSLTNSEF
jgi:predicted XRE-type DNA-binding protein